MGSTALLKMRETHFLRHRRFTALYSLAYNNFETVSTNMAPDTCKQEVDRVFHKLFANSESSQILLHHQTDKET